MSTEKTYAEINEKIKNGKAVVMTAEELIAFVEEKGFSRATQEVDVVTTGTFSPMCSSGAFLNFGHSEPRIRMQRVWLNDIEAYAGLAAVDAYIGATQVPEHDPLNSNYPGEFKYGGGHLLQELVERKRVKLKAVSYGTDCYPRQEIETSFTIDEINEAILFNPRNAYQNYNCAVNLSSRTIYTYMGVLKPNLSNAHYCSAGQLSPLLKDPYFKTIGIGTRIFLGGGVGYVAWNGTQHFPSIQKDSTGRELGPAGGTLALIGDLKQMNSQWLRGASFLGYGATLAVGIGLPIPILNEEITNFAAAKDKDLYAPIVDYSDAYPNRKPGNLGFVSYAELKTGEILVNGKKVPAAPLSSYPGAKKIAGTLKQWISDGTFLITEPVKLLPNFNDQITANALKS
ncbi:MAG: homocysteine biosynthesis protein [Eubacteriales bacterium]